MCVCVCVCVCVSVCVNSRRLPSVTVMVAPFSPQGLIFVVDSNDRERIAEAKDELEKMVRCLTHVVLCVLLCVQSVDSE